MGIHIEYMSFSDAQHQPQTWQDQVLGMVVFSGFNSANFNTSKTIPMLHLNAPVLTGDDIACEVWLSDTLGALPNVNNHLISGSQGAIEYRFNDELLFGVINLEESLSSQDVEQDDKISPLQRATEAAYHEILTLIDEQGYSHLYRFWNYMADINGSSHDLERYRQFNVGRKNVFESMGREQGNLLPAACALGLKAGPLSIAFLAGKTVATAVENPRQIKAYDYPKEYGPRTPSFSRATLAEIGQKVCLFISGTASIVGHETLHAEDIIGQTKETLINLEAVIAEANRIQGNPVFDLSTACFRVYVKHAQDVGLIRTEMQNHLKNEINAVFVQADICRAELLVEIEATLQSGMKALTTA